MPRGIPLHGNRQHTTRLTACRMLTVVCLTTRDAEWVISQCHGYAPMKVKARRPKCAHSHAAHSTTPARPPARTHAPSESVRVLASTGTQCMPRHTSWRASPCRTIAAHAQRDGTGSMEQCCQVLVIDELPTTVIMPCVPTPSEQVSENIDKVCLFVCLCVSSAPLTCPPDSVSRRSTTALSVASK